MKKRVREEQHYKQTNKQTGLTSGLDNLLLSRTKALPIAWGLWGGGKVVHG